MAKVKLHLDKRRTNRDNLYPLVIQLAHKGKTRTIPLKVYLSEKQWKTSNEEIKGVPNSGRMTAYVRKKLTTAASYLYENYIEVELLNINELKNILLAEINKQSHTSNKSIDRFIVAKTNRIYLQQYGNKIIDRLKKAGKYGYANAYKCGITALINFNGNNDLLLSDINVSFLKDFEADQLGKGNSKNTISAYLRPIRTLMNHAIQEELINANVSPFSTYKIPSNKRTRKRAVKKDVIIEIRKLNLKQTALRDARNYMLFIFNNRGINLIDIAKLKKHQIVNAKYKNRQLVEGRLEYTRSKTNRDFSIKLTPESIQILNEYKVFYKEEDDFIFPIGFENTERGRKNYDQRRKRINQRLKVLGEMIGLEDNITTYTIRHSWATIAKRNGVPISVIGESLGHEDYRTTETYLDSFDNDTLDDANDLVVS